MGCDIHLFTERKRNINNEEKWVNVDNWKLNPYYDKQDPYDTLYSLSSTLDDRNYTLFSILANVRNYSDNKFISEAKGLPEDLSEIIQGYVKRWEGDGHSHSFLTMKEIYDFYKENKTVKFSGFVNQQGLEKIENGKMPDFWCRDTNNEKMVYKEWEHKNYTLKNFIKKLEKHFKSEYYDKEKESENFRIVFWFDN